MVVITKDYGKKINNMAKDFKCKITDKYTMEILKMKILMDMENYYMKMEIFMMDNLKTTKEMVLENLNKKMDNLFRKDFGETINLFLSKITKNKRIEAKKIAKILLKLF